MRTDCRVQELNSVLYGDPNGKEIQKRGDVLPPEKPFLIF